jgi:hypothetical protein
MPLVGDAGSRAITAFSSVVEKELFKGETVGPAEVGSCLALYMLCERQEP